MDHDYHWFTKEMRKRLNAAYGTEAIKEEKPREFNVGDLVHVQLHGYGVILSKEQNYKGTLTTMCLVRTIDRYEPFWVDSDHLTLIRRMGEKDMAGIINNKIEKAPNKETGTFEPYAINKSDDSYQKALEAAKKMSNSMYGIGHSVITTVLRHDFNRFLNEVKDIKFSGPATIVFWDDGTKTVVKCRDDEECDYKKAIRFALLKKLAGGDRPGGTSNQANKAMRRFDEWLEKWIPEDLKEDTKPYDNLDYESEIYITEEMKKRLIGIGEGLNGLTDRLHSVNEKLREYLNDKPEETEEK